MTTTTPQTASSAAGPTVIPNVYHLTGKGVHVTYFPTGEGPLTTEGPVKLVYQDQHLARTFHAQEVTIADVANLGSVVTAVLWDVPDLGLTTVSLLIPTVELSTANSVPVQTLLITTMHSATLLGVGIAPQRDSYTVTKLSGTASTQILSL
jgi:hypothetical protein